VVLFVLRGKRRVLAFEQSVLTPKTATYPSCGR
jgi:hypothetical protein